MYVFCWLEFGPEGYWINDGTVHTGQGRICREESFARDEVLDQSGVEEEEG
jgi:hypothetical protein